MYRLQIALQEFQAVVLMLCRMGFCLSGMVVAIHLDKLLQKLIYVMRVV